MNCTCTRHAVSPRCPKHGDSRSVLDGWPTYLALVSLVALLYAAPDSLKGLALTALVLLFVVVTLPTESEPGRRRVPRENRRRQSDSQ